MLSFFVENSHGANPAHKEVIMAAIYASSNTIIRFDDGLSYVVRSFPPPQENHQLVDSMNRTEEEKRFLNLFVRIFYAASSGNLEECQKIIEKEKFNDIDAYSVRKFRHRF